tara:strand:+ start:444 stop:1007 length:564 start_codon:yes stop_codon:yes gene_type:complete
MELSSRAKDITGLSVGRLSVIKPAFRKGNYIYWLCQCECGEERFYTTGNLTQGTLRSCGCLRKNGGKDHQNWSGYGEVSATFFTKIKHQARRRKVMFGINIKNAAELFDEQDRRCAITGMELKMPSNSKQVFNGTATASLDRIDSNQGYIKGNVQWVHKDINMMKQQYSQEYFVRMCQLVTEHSKRD